MPLSASEEKNLPPFSEALPLENGSPSKYDALK
jgi:hypothetical protein